jgi:hypothetical protein
MELSTDSYQVEVATDYVFDHIEEALATNPTPGSKKDL